MTNVNKDDLSVHITSVLNDEDEMGYLMLVGPEIKLVQYSSYVRKFDHPLSASNLMLTVKVNVPSLFNGRFSLHNYDFSKLDTKVHVNGYGNTRTAVIHLEIPDLDIRFNLPWIVRLSNSPTRKVVELEYVGASIDREWIADNYPWFDERYQPRSITPTPMRKSMNTLTWRDFVYGEFDPTKSFQEMIDEMG